MLCVFVNVPVHLQGGQKCSYYQIMKRIVFYCIKVCQRE